MTESHFHLLVGRVLAGEASPEEQAQLELLLADAGRRLEFDELRVAYATLQDASKLLEAVNAKSEPMPAEALNRLLDRIRSRQTAAPGLLRPTMPAWIQVLLSRRAILGAVAAVGCLLILGWLIFTRAPAPLSPTGPVAHLVLIQGDSSVLRGNAPGASSPVQSLFEGDRVRLEVGAEAWLMAPTGIRKLLGPLTTGVADFKVFPGASSPEAAPTANARSPLDVALFTPRPLLLAAGLLATTRSANGISIYSPRGATARPEPTVLWHAEPGATYELTLRDELDPDSTSWHVRGVRPPVDFAAVPEWRDRPLAPDRVYRLIIRQTGRPLTVSEITFSTLAFSLRNEGDAPADRLRAAYVALSNSPSQTGDALTELLALPEPFASSELALRLKLLAFGRIGSTREYQLVQSKLERLP